MTNNKITTIKRMVSMRSYYDASATSWDYCYNFGPTKDLPANCDGDGSKGNFLSFGMQKIYGWNV